MALSLCVFVVVLSEGEMVMSPRSPQLQPQHVLSVNFQPSGQSLFIARRQQQDVLLGMCCTSEAGTEGWKDGGMEGERWRGGSSLLTSCWRQQSFRSSGIVLRSRTTGGKRHEMATILQGEPWIFILFASRS